ncbi:MAG: carbamoyltransferase family protein, partial [Ginsengibacter sp.]
SEAMIALFGAARKKGEPLTEYHKDMAASVQKMTELTIFHLVNRLHKRTGLNDLCLAGGVAQNSVANGKITTHSDFKNIYIPSAAHDAGISIGAALYVQHQLLHEKRMPAILSAYTGSHFTNDEIRQTLRDQNIRFTEHEDEIIYEKVTECLVGGGVVGWFSGKSEFGPRALGGRSILADPRRQDAKQILNSKIKRRESFRPFAPSVLKEFVAEYFEQNDAVPFMEKVFLIKENKRKEIPAVTHVDGTGRLQTVDKNVSPRYYQLIDTFRKKTGVPILLNTSFNENEPIVNTPEDALNCYLRTDMDMLIMENILISRA